MNPAQTAQVLMRALMKGDSTLVEQCMKYTTHMVEVSSKMENYQDLQNHSIRCGLCFSFQIKSGGLMLIEDYWKATEDDKQPGGPDFRPDSYGN